MLSLSKQYLRQRQLFKRSYCLGCNQQKSCGQLDDQKEYCCSCFQTILEELERDELLIDAAQQMLNDYRAGRMACQCLGSEKPRAKYISYDGSGWSKCERSKCKRTINSAGHHGVIKNQNDPRFWGLNVPQKILCGACLKKLVRQMPTRKRYLFKEYEKRECWS